MRVKWAEVEGVKRYRGGCKDVGEWEHAWLWLGIGGALGGVQPWVC